MTDSDYFKHNTVVKKFMADLNLFLQAHYTQTLERSTMYYADPERYIAKLTVGRKFLKIVVGNCVWGFIARTDDFVKGEWTWHGDLLMAAGQTPAKHSRGNITDGTAQYDVYGPNYIR